MKHLFGLSFHIGHDNMQIVNAEQYNCVDECITIAAMLSVGNAIFYRPKDQQKEADNTR